MTAVGSRERPVGDLVGAAEREAERYARGADRPLGAYLTLLSVYAGSVGALGLLVRRRGALPERLDGRDLAILGVATHKLSRLLTKDSVTAVVRAPFTTFDDASGEGEVHEEVRGEGLRHAIGELVSCPFCLSVWVATALAFGLVLAPRSTRFFGSILSAVAGSDFLQLAYATAQQASHEQ
jgi:hypothetical protein